MKKIFYLIIISIFLFSFGESKKTILEKMEPEERKFWESFSYGYTEISAEDAEKIDFNSIMSEEEKAEWAEWELIAVDSEDLPDHDESLEETFLTGTQK